LSGFWGEAAAQQMASPGEASRVLSCFYECKWKGAPRTPGAWLEMTTLMLVNQRASTPLTADILFVTGNERPFASTTLSLSPEDLDELNVCETLAQPPLPFPPPPAGLMEVVLTNASPTGGPHDGAYGWIKNLVGTFKRPSIEPVQTGKVDGIGKTQCRVVPPTVTTPDEISRKLGQVPPERRIKPILIEKTGE